MSAHFYHYLPGANALSAARTQSLLAQLQALDERVATISARYAHWVHTMGEPSAADWEKIQALLVYGEPAEVFADAPDELVVVMPRLGTISPWASKATDIARNCGLAVLRIERAVEYRINLKSGGLKGLFSSSLSWSMPS